MFYGEEVVAVLKRLGRSDAKEQAQHVERVNDRLRVLASAPSALENANPDQVRRRLQGTNYRVSRRHDMLVEGLR